MQVHGAEAGKREQGRGEDLTVGDCCENVTARRFQLRVQRFIIDVSRLHHWQAVRLREDFDRGRREDLFSAHGLIGLCDDDAHSEVLWPFQQVPEGGDREFRRSAEDDGEWRGHWG